jgi:hypothetical protein
LFDRIATVTKDTSISVDIRNRRTAGSGVDVTIIINAKTDAVTACCDLFEICATKCAVFANWELVFLTSAAIDDSEGARATARSRSVSKRERRKRR